MLTWRDGYGLFVALELIGAVAEASLEAAFAAIAEFEAELAAAIAALASEAAVLSAVLASFFLHAATETAAIAAPTIRMLRSVPEVIVPGPIGLGCSAVRDAVAQYAGFAPQRKSEFTTA